MGSRSRESFCTRWWIHTKDCLHTLLMKPLGISIGYTDKWTLRIRCVSVYFRLPWVVLFACWLLQHKDIFLLAPCWGFTTEASSQSSPSWESLHNGEEQHFKSKVMRGHYLFLSAPRYHTEEHKTLFLSTQYQDIFTPENPLTSWPCLIACCTECSHLVLWLFGTVVMWFCTVVAVSLPVYLEKIPIKVHSKDACLLSDPLWTLD